MKPELLSGQAGKSVDRLLRVSTIHAPEPIPDIGAWCYGEQEDLGMHWIFAYEEDPDCPDSAIPEWLLRMCIVARDVYNCNWILLSPDGETIPELPLYKHQ